MLTENIFKKRFKGLNSHLKVEGIIKFSLTCHFCTIYFQCQELYLSSRKRRRRHHHCGSEKCSECQNWSYFSEIWLETILPEMNCNSTNILRIPKMDEIHGLRSELNGWSRALGMWDSSAGFPLHPMWEARRAQLFVQGYNRRIVRLVVLIVFGFSCFDNIPNSLHLWNAWGINLVCVSTLSGKYLLCCSGFSCFSGNLEPLSGFRSILYTLYVCVILSMLTWNALFLLINNRNTKNLDNNAVESPFWNIPILNDHMTQITWSVGVNILFQSGIRFLIIYGN